MNILGISAYYHDSAACLVQDGKIIAAAQEERFTRKKHDQAFPKNAIEYCLKEAGISKEDIDYVAFYEKPFLKFERILEAYLSYAPLGVRSFLKALPVWIKQKLWIKELIANELGFKGKIIFPEHHQAHAASAFFPSPYKEAAVLTMDGVGEWATSSFGVGEGNQIRLLKEIRFPHSLGLLYSAFTYYTGFRVNSGEYKVMGLAPYGEPKYKDLILEHLLDLKEDGSFRLDMSYFNYGAGLTMTSGKFHKLFGGPPRKPESRISQKDMDLARSVQDATEEVMLRMAKHVRQVTGKRYLCLAGGVSLNCVGNGKIMNSKIFDHIWIQPAAGDAGGALGAALFVWHQYLNKPRERNNQKDTMHGSLLGPKFNDNEIEDYLTKEKIPFKKLPENDLVNEVAELILKGNVIGWFQGRMEFGPRALGARSIIGDAKSPKMQSLINLKIKFRESFRPFAPSVLDSKAKDYFDVNQESPYMLLVAPVQKSIRQTMTDEQQKLFGIEKLNIPRSTIPAVTHVDYSARVQTVDQDSNPLYHALLQRIDALSGCPVIINTSFNVRGEPLVCRPEEAFQCFMRTHMDYLILGPYVLAKKDQTQTEDNKEWMKEFALD